MSHELRTLLNAIIGFSEVLTLTKKFVELHGGQIWVTSEVDKGSTFTFTFTVPERRWPESPGVPSDP